MVNSRLCTSNLTFLKSEYLQQLQKNRVKMNSAPGLPHYKRFSVMLVRRSGRGSKTLFLWLLRSGSSIVSIPQKACSALLRGFESRNRDWEQKNRIFVYNAFALNKPLIISYIFLLLNYNIFIVIKVNHILFLRDLYDFTNGEV